MSDLYAAEDAQRILQIAIAKETESGDLSRTQLLEIAVELGIEADTLWAAEKEWLALNDEAQEHQIFQTFRKQKFQHHLVRYVIVDGFLVVIDLLAGGGLGFSLYIALFWGLGLSLHAWKAFQCSGYRYQQAFEKWRRHRRMKKSMGKFVNRLLGT